MPYIKLVDPDRSVTTEIWGTVGGMYGDEIFTVNASTCGPSMYTLCARLGS